MNHKIFFCFLLLGLFMVIHSCDDGPTEAQNRRPVIAGIVAAPDSMTLGDSSFVTCFASDPDGDSLTFEWTLLNTGTIRETEEPNVIKVFGIFNTIPVLEIKCRVTDGRGGVTTATALVNIFDPNLDPVITRVVADPKTITAFNDSSLVTCTARDPEGSEIEYSWRLNGSPAGIRIFDDAPNQARIFPVTGNTVIEVVCRASDGGTGFTLKTTNVDVTGITATMTAEKDTVQVNEPTTITYTVQDEDGDQPQEAEYIWSSSGIKDGTITNTAEANVIEWSGDIPGDYQVKVIVNGEFGRIDERSYYVTVIE